MKVVILAGGLGTRLSEETSLRPKPMVEIGGKPILWHIMKTYSYYGYNDFVICCGYKGYYIKEYFYNYFSHNVDFTIDISKNSTKSLTEINENWKVTLIDTGNNTMTGGRVLRVKNYLENKPFMLTYGDGVSDINISSLVDHHKNNKKKITITAVQPGGRFGSLGINHKNNDVLSFVEKPKGDGTWINGGFMVCEAKFLDFIKDDTTVFEQYPLNELARINEMSAFKHKGFWRPCDTLKDKNDLNELWNSDKPNWKIW